MCMKTIMLIHGPNLNKLGAETLAIWYHEPTEKLKTAVKLNAKDRAYDLNDFQSNHEGDLID